MRSMLHLYLLLAGVLAFVAPAEAKDPPTQGLRYASLTPDGKRVVFCYRGDIWVGDVDGGGHIDRLTIHEAQDTLARVSPDGKHVAFSSRRNGNYDVFVMPITGGEPKQLTFHSGFEAVCDWSPDGKKLLFTSERAASRGRTDLYEVAIDGGTPRRITFDGARDGSYSKDGKQIVYVRGFISIYWDNYKGSANYDIYVTDAKGGTPRRITDTDGNERWPFFSEDGQSIYFRAEEGGVANFYSIPVAGGKRTKITNYLKADVHRPDMNWDYKTVVFERVGRLYVTDLSKPNSPTKSLNFVIRSDVRNSGIETRTITTGGEHVHISRDGRTAVFSLRGDIWMMSSSGGRGRRITQGPAKDEWPRLSPDGHSIAYQSTVRGNSDIFLLDLKTGKTRPLTTHRANDFFHNWSPDGKTLVFCSERSGNRDIWLLDVESGTKTQVTKHRGGDDDPSFSPDGKTIVFDSAREGVQAIYTIRLDGSNVRRITGGARAFYQVPSYSPDGSMIVFEGFIPAGGRSGGLYVVSASGGPVMQISRDGQGACWSNDHIYFTAERGRAGNGIWRVKAPESVEAGERIPFIGTVEVDLRRELANLFDECWTALRDGFYDPKMHGVKWNDMKRKYRAMAIDAENKDEFQNVVRQMLAELGASHLGIFGGSHNGNAVTPSVSATGYLGLEFEDVVLDDGSRRVADVQRAGPADRAGVRVGDVVTRIGRTKLRKNTNLDKVLTGTVGKTIALTFKPRSAEGLGEERTTPIEPISFGALRQLKHNDWTRTCAKRVKEATKGKGGEVAYLHLDAMNGPNLAKFQSAVARWNRSSRIKGMVLDVRDNGGGNIHNQLMSVLWAKPLARVRVRNGPEVVQPALYWDKPIVLLINERSFSDAEVFPHMFKAAGIGKIVGVPTPGGVIGTTNITLSDGSSFRIPRTGFKTMKGKNLEGLGVKPDVVVEETAEDRSAGRDPQLEKAIEIIKAEVAARTRRKPTTKKPTPKPKPQPKPEPKPDTQPVMAKGVQTLLDAKPGEWVRYRYTEPGSEQATVFKLIVKGVHDGMVLVDREIEKGGAAVPPLPLRMKQMKLLDALKQFGALQSSFEVDGKVGDKPARLLRADVKWPDGSMISLTFTNIVPVYGLLKVELGKTVILEAIEWGAPVDRAPIEAQPGAKPEAKGNVPVAPLFDAKEGEWVKMKRFGPNGQELEILIKVDEVSDDEIVLKQTIFVQGREIEGPPMRRPRKKELTPPERFGEAKSYGTEEITIGDKTLKCISMTAEDPNGGGTLKWLYSKEIPVMGLVRVIRDGRVFMEIVEWGTDNDG